MFKDELTPRIENEVREAAKSFTEIKGNGVFSEEIFVSFFKHLRTRYHLMGEYYDWHKDELSKHIIPIEYHGKKN
jgi:hypothetical protein